MAIPMGEMIYGAEYPPRLRRNASSLPPVGNVPGPGLKLPSCIRLDSPLLSNALP